ncbi:metal-dependent phosphohydrolase, partial [Streptomyces sp. NPDC057540]
YALLGTSAGTATTHGVLQTVAVVVARGRAGVGPPHAPRPRGGGGRHSAVHGVTPGNAGFHS